MSAFSESGRSGLGALMAHRSNGPVPVRSCLSGIPNGAIDILLALVRGLQGLRSLNTKDVRYCFLIFAMDYTDARYFRTLVILRPSVLGQVRPWRAAELGVNMYHAV